MKTIRASICVVVLGGLLGGAPVRAEDSRTRDLCDAAENPIGSVNTWREFYAYFKTYYGCDNGAIAEGISDKVEQLMTHDWASLSSVTAKLRSDKAFRTLLLNHIDETWSSEDIEIARQNAASHCPQGLDAFCKTVVSTVADVEKYSAEDAAKDSK